MINTKTIISLFVFTFHTSCLYNQTFDHTVLENWLSRGLVVKGTVLLTIYAFNTECQRNGSPVTFVTFVTLVTRFTHVTQKTVLPVHQSKH